MGILALHPKAPSYHFRTVLSLIAAKAVLNTLSYKRGLYFILHHRIFSAVFMYHCLSLSSIYSIEFTTNKPFR